jgi:SMC interacting uncharacterized protein involved in chromosome segregation
MQLEKAVREIREEIALVKFTSQKKMSDAQSLEANLEEKSLEIEAKLHAADAKLAEANRKKSQADRDLEEVETRQRRMEKEKLYFETEYGNFLSHFSTSYCAIQTIISCFIVLARLGGSPERSNSRSRRILCRTGRKSLKRVRVDLLICRDR